MTDRQSPFGPGPTGLYRNVEEGRIAGVCAGLADYFGVSPRALARQREFP
jgi:PspC domain